MRAHFPVFLLLVAFVVPTQAQSAQPAPLLVAQMQHDNAPSIDTPTAQAQLRIERLERIERSERRRVPQFELPAADSYSQSGDGASDGGRKTGKLSSEERRALRRQINEAGNDLYAPR